MASLLLRKARIPLLIQRRTFVRSFALSNGGPQRKQAHSRLQEALLQSLPDLKKKKKQSKKKKEELTSMLADLRDNEFQKQQAFPSLNKEERSFVEEMAEQLGFHFNLAGIDKNRKVVVRKPKNEDKLFTLSGWEEDLVKKVEAKLGASGVVVSQEYRTQLTRQLIELRDDESRKQQTFPANIPKGHRSFVRALAPELGLKLSGNVTTANKKIVVKKEKVVELKKSDVALIKQVGFADVVLDRSRTNLTRMLMDFRDDEAQNQQAFPATLTKSDREFLHALSKQLGFRSKSKGLGENRKLVITKKRNARVPAMKLKGVVPVLKIGAIGKDALRDHMEKHPLSCAELIDSHQTGVSLTTGLDNEATLERLTQLGLSAPEKVNRVTKYRFHADLERRLRVHETAQRSKEGHRSFEQMLKKRAQLPAYNHEKRIVEIVDANPITIIWGDTGCGKSTQVPQFLLDANPTCSIVCTQPRRISAISLAERVAQEQMQTVGGMVGYKVRMDSAVTPDTQLVFVTPGLLLKKMHSDPMLEEYTHIILDEIHGRDKYQEFLLILLRDLLPRRPDLRVVLMSATLKSDELIGYFEERGVQPAVVAMEGRMFPVQEYFLEDVLKETKYLQGGPRKRRATIGPTASSQELLDTYHETNREDTIDNSLLLEVVRHIEKESESDDAILMFFPGWSDISGFRQILERTPPFSGSDFLVLPLHSGIPSREQRRVLERPPPGVRKIVLATNIAETSLTIDDISYVVDTGREKEKSYDAEIGTSTLQNEWISGAAAKQRKGRAGRVKPGICYHLFSNERHQSMRAFSESELLRTPLEEICLMCKQLEVAPGGPDDSNGIPAFLRKAMTAPSQRAIWNALDLLVDLGAMHPETNELTPLGDCLSVLSVEPRVGKMVIWSYILGCARVASNMACGMSSKSPFVMPHPEEKFAAQNAMVELSQNSESDPITIHHVLEEQERWGKSGFNDFCRSNYLSIPSMKTIADSRRGLKRELKSLGFPSPSIPNMYQNRHDEDNGLWTAAIAAGLYPNVAFRTQAENKFSTISRQKGKAQNKSVNSAMGPLSMTHAENTFSTMSRQKVKAHSNSVNSAKGQPLSTTCMVPDDELELMCYGEMVKGDWTFTVSQTTLLASPLPLLLLCGKSLTVRPQAGNESMSILNLDDIIAYKCDAETAGHVAILRKRLESAFWHAISNRSHGLSTLTAEERDAVDIVGTVLQSAHQTAPIRNRDVTSAQYEWEHNNSSGGQSRRPR